MTGIVDAAHTLGSQFGLDAKQIAVVLLFVLLCFLTGKGLKYALDRVQNIIDINGSIQKQLQGQLQAAHLLIAEQQEYIVALRRSAAKHIDKIDALEKRLDAEELKMQKMRLFLVNKGLFDELDGYKG